HRSESINIGSLYDFMYVLEDREVIDINKQFLGNDPELEKKITYLGKITNKVREEIAPRAETFKRFGLPMRKTVLVSLGRNNRVVELSRKLLELLASCEISSHCQVAMVLDPYLPQSAIAEIKDHPLSQRVRFLSFTPDLIDLVAHSELVVCRAGYNIVNEILLTGARALLIPESHGSGEQEQRAKSVKSPNIKVISEDKLLSASEDHFLKTFFNNHNEKHPAEYDKYAIGKKILEDLEAWIAKRTP
ncbi:MAG: glycosyltransferase, partial [Desulfomonilaceae bacterium]